MVQYTGTTCREQAPAAAALGEIGSGRPFLQAAAAATAATDLAVRAETDLGSQGLPPPWQSKRPTG